MRNTLYAALWTFIAAISAIDTYLCVRYAETLLEFEQNPFGLWLIAVDGVPIFIAAKFFGTSVVLAILFGLRRHWTAFPVTGVIAIIQALLLCYLLTA